MSSFGSLDDDSDECELFPITQFDSVDSEPESPSSQSESAHDASDECDDSDDDLIDIESKKDQQEHRGYVSLRQRRLSRALASFESLKVNVTKAHKNWIAAIRKARNLEDPWAVFHLDEYPVERCIRHRYHALKQAWVTDEVKVKMEKQAFNKGAMRECFRLKKSSTYRGVENWNHTHNFVAKQYMEEVSRHVYFQDVKLQMDAKLWGEEYSRHNPPKKVDIFQMYILEFKNRPGSPLYHCEHFIEGDYIKYNSNSGFVDTCMRYTPHAFSHFTFERSGHQLIVVDIQGVGDLYTDPQIHTIDGKEYGDGNLGAKGMALFFHSHKCNDICRMLRLSEFDLSPNEIKLHNISINKIVMPHTVARGCEEPLGNHFHDTVDITNMLKRQRSISSTASDSGFEGVLSSLEEEPMSQSPITSPGQYLQRSRVRYFSESESSITSQEEEIKNFHLQMKKRHRPACVALEKDFRENNSTRVNDSALGKIHHELAKYHEAGRFTDKKDSDIDWESALFHEIHAAELGELEAILTLAKLYLGMERVVLLNCVIKDDPKNIDQGMDYMIEVANAGDRSAIIYVAKAFETGQGLGTTRTQSWEHAIQWYEKALDSVDEHDEGGEYDSTMNDPQYLLMARMADMYMQGKHGLKKMPEKAAELYNRAAEAATEAMKGRLANKYYALAEEAYSQCEEE